MSATGLLCACVLVCLLPCAVAAYTLVMRDGHRIEVPDHFNVTPTTLTYEAAPGLYVTVQLTQLDIAATERANREPPGSLLRRATAPRDGASMSSTPAPRRAARTLTNRELEPLRRARLASERASEERRKELGLPAPETEKRDDAEEARRLRELAQRRAAANAEAESYWRARAAALREETAALDAQIDYLRARLGADAAPRLLAPVALVSTFNPFFGAQPFHPFFGSRPLGPVFASPGGAVVGTRATTLGVGVTVGGGGLRGRVVLGEQRTSGAFRRRGFGAPFVFGPTVAALAVPFDYASADTSALRLRLVELEAARAGLDARWAELEDEARQAGALPGWLRE
ncbi:MAG TPA: hypothetical protein VF546_21110 [Pyrinomonadaceae bacterium]|jgi:hypothetical protein